MRFGTDGDGNRGYYGADGSLIPFKSGVKAICIYAISQLVTKNLFTATEEMNGFYLFTTDDRQTAIHLYKNNVEIDKSAQQIVKTISSSINVGLVYISVPIAVNDIISYKPGGGGTTYGLVLSENLSYDSVGNVH